MICFRLALPVLLAVLPYACAIAAEELTIEGVGIGREVACASQDVGIYGSSNAIQLTGKCGKVVIHGDSHKIRFEQAAEVEVSGTQNKVDGGEAGRIAVEVAKNEIKASLKSSGKAQLEVAGAENIVSVALAGPAAIDVSGADHKVTWSTRSGVRDPEISMSGADHSVRRVEQK